jgi:hypothetical protein
MTTTLKVTAFEVARCGYFLPRKKIAEFGSLADCLSDFHAWTTGKNLEDTLTFKVDGEDVQETYCFEMQKSNKTGNYLITTWNKVPMVEGGVPTANGSAKVGKVDVALAKVANGNIPGYPSYFYFLPSSNAVFAMKAVHFKRSALHLSLFVHAVCLHTIAKRSINRLRASRKPFH